MSGWVDAVLVCDDSTRLCVFPTCISLPSPRPPCIPRALVQGDAREGLGKAKAKKDNL